MSIDDLPLSGFAPLPAIPAAFADEVAADLATRFDWISSAAHMVLAQLWDRGKLVRDIGDMPREVEVTGLLGEITGNAAPQYRFTQRQVQHWQQRSAAIDAARFGRQTPFDRITHDFGLSPLAQAVLLAVAAPTVRGELVRVYRMISNDRSRPTCDEAMLRVLLVDLFATATMPTGDPEADALARAALFAQQLSIELDSDGALRTFGLVCTDDGIRPYAALTIDPMLQQLLSEQIVDDTGMVKPRFADRDLDELFLPGDQRARTLAYLTAVPADHRVRLVVRGRTGSGRRTLLCSLAARAGRPLGLIDVGTIPRDTPDFAGELAQQLRRALFRGMVPCVSGLETLFASDENTLKRDVGIALAKHPGPLCIRLPTETPIPLPPGYLRVDFDPPNEMNRIAIWQNALERYALNDVAIDDLAARNRIGPGIVNRVCEDLAMQHGIDTPASWQPLIETAVSQHLQNRLGNTATHVTRRATWADIVLPNDILDSLIELTSRVRHRKTVFETWGFDKTITTSRGITALFAGTPGTGKTMVAGVLARDLGLELFRVDVSRLTSKWIGETEKNLASLFDAAEDGQVMLLFDECDSLFAKRTEVKTSTDRHANMQVNYLLQRLDTFEGVAILTTNFATSIDPAFKRRLTYRITFPFPDEIMREQLWRTMLPQSLPLANNIDFGELARRYRMSGGYIRNAALRAAFFAAEDSVMVTQGHIERAVKAEFAAIGKLGDTGTLE